MGNNSNPDFCSFKNLSQNVVTELTQLINVINVYNPDNKDITKIENKLKSINIEDSDSFEITELLSNLSLDINNLQVDLLQEERENLHKLSLVLSKIDKYVGKSLENTFLQRENLSSLSDEITVDLKSFENIEINSKSTISGVKNDILKNTTNVKEKISNFIVQQEELVQRQEDCINNQKNEITEMKEKMVQMENDLQELKRLSCLDPLTGIKNRKGYEEYAENINQYWKMTGNNTSLLILDIDHFKKINDQYGHSVGDEVLRYIGKILQRVESLYKETHCSRYGGEEFTITITDTEPKEVLQLATKIRNTVAKHPVILKSGQNIDITLSIGLSHFAQKYDNLKSVFKLADAALYKAKEKRNSISVANKDGVFIIDK